MYANARLACAAHEKEMMEATARMQAQRELAAAQAQAAQRALTVAREKAAHEAKSEVRRLTDDNRLDAGLLCQQLSLRPLLDCCPHAVITRVMFTQ
jgi:hypothetical protein